MKLRYLTAQILAVVFLSSPVFAEKPRIVWAEAEEVEDLEDLNEAINRTEDEGRKLRNQPVMLAYQSAGILSHGILDVPLTVKSHAVSADFAEDNKGRGLCVVEVQFNAVTERGDIHGEIYQVKLKQTESRDWSPWFIEEVFFSIGKRASKPATVPKSGKFSDFLKQVKTELRLGAIEISHEEFKTTLKFLPENKSPDPIDPMVIGLLGDQISANEVILTRDDFAARVTEYVNHVELVGETPVVVIKSLDDVKFAVGIRVLAEMSKGGVKEIYLFEARPHRPDVKPNRSIPRHHPTQKPTPPSGFFPK